MYSQKLISLCSVKYLAHRKFHKKVTDVGNVYNWSCSNVPNVRQLLRKLLNSTVPHVKQDLYSIHMNHLKIQTLAPKFIEIPPAVSEMKQANTRKAKQDLQIVCPFYALHRTLRCDQYSMQTGTKYFTVYLSSFQSSKVCQKNVIFRFQ
jgi:hypothetical protein